MTPTGFCAQAALDAARGLYATTAMRVEHQALGDLQAELFHTRVGVNQTRAELERNVHAADVEYQTRVALVAAIAKAADSLADLDDVISYVHQQLRRLHTHDSQGAVTNL